MSINTLDFASWNRISVGLGSIAWMLIVLVRLLGWIVLNDLELFLLLAFCVLTPLAIPLVSGPGEYHLLCDLARLVILLQPFATLIGGASFLVSTGALAAAASTVWLLFTALLALMGLVRLLQKSGRSLADACLAMALVYVPIGGAWLVLARLGLQPLGFSPIIVLLTAVHFHFITLVALIITGLTGQAIRATQREVSRNVYRVAAIGMLVNPLLVAAGIALTQVTGVRFLESGAAVLLALSLLLIALLSYRFIVPGTTPRLAKGLLIFSNAAVLITMLFASAYALGAATGGWTITISQMLTVHGWLNALAFGLCGLLGWRLRVKQQEG